MSDKLGAEGWELAGSFKRTRPLSRRFLRIKQQFSLEFGTNEPGSYLIFDTSIIEKELNKLECTSLRKLVAWRKLGLLDLFAFAHRPDWKSGEFMSFSVGATDRLQPIACSFAYKPTVTGIGGCFCTCNATCRLGHTLQNCASKFSLLTKHTAAHTCGCLIIVIGWA